MFTEHLVLFGKLLKIRWEWDEWKRERENTWPGALPCAEVTPKHPINIMQLAATWPHERNLHLHTESELQQAPAVDQHAALLQNRPGTCSSVPQKPELFHLNQLLFFFSKPRSVPSSSETDSVTFELQGTIIILFGELHLLLNCFQGGRNSYHTTNLYSVTMWLWKKCQ